LRNQGAQSQQTYVTLTSRNSFENKELVRQSASNMVAGLPGDEKPMLLAFIGFFYL